MKKAALPEKRGPFRSADRYIMPSVRGSQSEISGM